ncbi:hypothetical protein HX13_04315 [Chryseobacterium sp. P1-3]|uniref:hypothetical protein n=1 Tax=Chryseobacterium sp. (strain P1-3) TaxID=1517683 RepID=UPI0004E609F0|nr:hypothetical protein [Chryseobacterium sp. P1-3]KFF75414.1 hypothetical protein HX13_04315 [Chryseobacterium sp. P1-3]
MKKIILVYTLLLSFSGYGQYVEVIEKGKKENLSPKDFMIPLKETEEYQSAFVGRYRAYYPDTYIGHLFTAIAEEAERKGANAYHIVSYKEGGQQNDSELVLDTYSIEETEIDKVSGSLEKNVIYIFGDPSTKENSASNFKINGEKREVKNNALVKVVLKENEEVKITKGGITGMSIWVKWKPEQFNKFYSFSGLGVDGAGFGSNGASIVFNTGRIFPVDRDLGYFLIQVLKESK